MKSVFVLIDQRAGKVDPAAYSLLSVAKSLVSAGQAAELRCIAFGGDSAALSAALAGFGVAKLLHWGNPAGENISVEVGAAFLEELVRGSEPVAVILAANSFGRELAPMVAAALEAGQASDIIQVNSDGSFRRPVYAGDALCDLRLTTPNIVITVRTSAIAPLAAAGSDLPPVETIQWTPPSDLRRSRRIAFEGSSAERPELTAAKIVVSGGRGVQSKEGFESAIFPLADALGAAVGASRAAVDSGFAPNDWQVGQTGKVVAPDLYIAVGLSGAVQHLAGMKGSKVIVAINKDPEAPIFEVADLGLEADLFQAVPELVEGIKGLK